jgi:gluconate:H+ symporter, GntP family
MSIAHLVIAVVGIAVLIVKLKVNPAIALLIGTLYFGLASGLGFSRVIELVTSGFGDLMAEVGLVIALGVLMGSVMSATCAIQRIVEAVLRLFGRNGSPYAFGVAIGAVMPAIYFDVVLVLVAPVARRVAERTGLRIALVAGPIAIGLMAANSIIVPGSAVVAYSGALDVPIGRMLLYGLLVGIPAIVLTTAGYVWWARRGLWNERFDESDSIVEEAVPLTEDGQRLSLIAALAPILTTIALVVLGAFSASMGPLEELVDFVAHPVVALFAGLVVALAVAARRLDADRREQVLADGLGVSGSILVVTGVAGSLGAMIAESGVADILQSLFTTTPISPLLLAWLVAAALRTAQGAATISGLTGIAIIAPLVGSLGIDPVLLALAAGAGASFGGNFSDNAFWMFRSFYGLTTRGTLKTYTLAQSMFSIVTLLIVMVVSVTGAG